MSSSTSARSLLRKMLPYLAPEERAAYGGSPNQPYHSPDYYFSKQRARQVLSVLPPRKGDLGVGLLRKAASLLERYGSTPGEGMSKSAYRDYLKEAENLLSQAASRLGQGTASLMKAFLMPRSYMRKSMRVGTESTYVLPNRKLFL